MKKFIISISCFLLFTAKLFAQVSGYAYLEDQTNHAGIKVVFTAQSPTAISDSCLTDETGFYSKTLSKGAYLIKMIKENSTAYNTKYNNVLVNTIQQVLSPVTLDITYILISGNLSGTLSKNNLYKVIGLITIPQGQSLIIEEGVQIKGNNNYLSCEGNVTILGQNKNVTIDALTIYSTKKLEINNSVISNSNIRNGRGSVFIHNSELNNTNVESHGDSTSILNCYVHDFQHSYYVLDGSGNYLNISCNIFKYCGSAIQILDNKKYSIIKNNYIETDNTNPILQRSIGIRASSSIINNNIVKSSHIGIYFTEGVVSNNNVFNCDTACKNNVDPNSFPSYIYNNNFLNNKIAIDINNNSGADSISRHLIKNNLFYKNTQYNVIHNLRPTIAGNYFTTNVNGDSIDVYNNILSNPQILDTNGFTYANSSPLIKNGKDGANIGVQFKNTCFDPSYTPPSPDSLKISGTVHYSKLENLEKNAHVIAYNLDNQNIYSTYTDSLGKFEFDSLSTGKYILKTIPSTHNHVVTFYPATTDSLQSAILDLHGNISGIDIIIDIETGISNDTEDNEIKVYPNPFDNLLHIRNFNKNINYNKINIVNSLGDVKLEFNQADETSEIILDLTILPAGVYFLNLETIDSKIIRKVIKN